MKKWIALISAFALFSCNSMKKFSDFDISYARSGGFAPIYENLLIKGHNVHYSWEGHQKKSEKDLKISDAELDKIFKTLENNGFKNIQEDRKKMYDNIATTINVKKGSQQNIKTDDSGILEKDEQKWQNITAVFTEFITSKNLNNP